jgi:hypothetical protein
MIKFLHNLALFRAEKRENFRENEKTLTFTKLDIAECRFSNFTDKDKKTKCITFLRILYCQQDVISGREHRIENWHDPSVRHGSFEAEQPVQQQDVLDDGGHEEPEDVEPEHLAPPLKLLRNSVVIVFSCAMLDTA